MAKVVSLVSVLGRINPAAFDAIFPHGPIPFRAGAAGRLAPNASEINPQPLPPKDALLVASATVARDIAFAALSAEAAGNADGAGRLIKSAVDEWCGNGRPRFPIPWPGPWPFPWPPEPEPHPEWDVVASRVVGALSLAAVASRLSNGAVRDALAAGAERLLDVALG
jgi:hypothetical protein